MGGKYCKLHCLEGKYKVNLDKHLFCKLQENDNECNFDAMSNFLFFFSNLGLESTQYKCLLPVCNFQAWVQHVMTLRKQHNIKT